MFIIFNNDLLIRRNLKKLSQKKLAEKVGVQRHKISMLEHGHILPTLNLLEKITKILDIRLSEIYPAEIQELLLKDNCKKQNG